MAEGATRPWLDACEDPELEEWRWDQERQRRRALSASELRLELAQRLAHAHQSQPRAIEFVAYQADVARECSSLRWVEELHLSDTKVSELEPLAGLTSLTQLDLSGTQLSDLEPLTGLTNLTHLNLANTTVSELMPLAKLTNLSHLNLANARVTELGPLARLMNLTGLDLSGTQVSDMGPLTGLTNLSQLDLGQTDVSGLAPLAKLTNLSQLDLSDTRVSELGPLAKLTNLSQLNLSDTDVSDLWPLTGLTNLSQLDLSDTGVSELRSLPGLTNLTQLHLTYTGVSDLAPLAGLTNLSQLHLAETCVSELGPLAELTNLSQLDLGHTDVSELGPLAKLTNLSQLDLSDTRVSELGPLAKLTKLSQLDLRHTSVSALTPLAGLASLSQLDLSYTRVDELGPLAELTNLSQLKLIGTRVNELGPLARLTNLYELALSHVPLSELGPVAGLTNLSELDVSYTRVSALGPLAGLTNLSHLDLTKTGLREAAELERVCRALPRLHTLFASPFEGIPAELFEGECSQKLREYFVALESGATTNHELKVVLVGNGYVGKTTLAARLLGREAPDFGVDDRTHGIVTWEFPLDLGTGETIRVRLWDFSGQAIYHATHRCFLHRGAIYLLLWTEEDEASPRETPARNFEANEPIGYWLHSIEHLAPQSPIILVKNKTDQSDLRSFPRGIAPDEKPFSDQCSISARQGVGVQERLLPILRMQAQTLRHQWGHRLPKSWNVVRHELERLRSSNKPLRSMDRGHFDRICRQCGAEGTSTLLGYLHDTGFLYYRSGIFSDLIVLDQNWFIGAVYKLLDPRPKLDARGRKLESPRDRIRDRLGRFSGTAVREFWGERDDADYETFLAFMKQAGVLYEISPASADECKTLDERQFVLPDLLPPLSDLSVRAALADWPPHGTVVVELEFDFLPRSFLHQLMAKAIERSSGFEAWTTGFLYTSRESGARARIEHRPGSDGRGDLQIEFSSTHGDALDGLRLLLAEVKAVDGAEWKRLWVGTDATQSGGRVELSRLLRAFEKRPPAAYVPTRDDETVPAEDYRLFLDLLNEAGRDMPQKPASEQRPIRLFISYAHADGPQFLQRFETTLNGLKRTTFAHLEWWHDRKLIPGAHWETALSGRREQAILDELNRADIVCMLVSPDFINSDYCWSKELPLALRQYTEKNGGFAVPIIIRDTPDWYKSKLGPLQALPKDAKPLEDWPSADKFWASVSEGLGKTIQRVGDVRAAAPGPSPIPAAALSSKSSASRM